MPAVPDGVYINTPWIEPGGEIWLNYVGTTPECGDGYNGYTREVTFVTGSSTYELQGYGFGDGYWIGRGSVFLEPDYTTPLPVGLTAPVTGNVVLSCTPDGGGATQTLSFPLTVGPTPPASIYHSPTAWTWYTPGPVTPGSTATVNALGYTPGESVTVNMINSDIFDDTLDLQASAAVPVNVTADGSGAVTAQVVIPAGWAEGDSIHMVVVGATSKYLIIPGQGSPLLSDPSISAASNEGAFPGGAVSVSATGFYGGETVQLALHRESGAAIALSTLTADVNGDISGVVSIPSSVTPGSYRLWMGAKVIDYLLLNTPLTITTKPDTPRLAGTDRFKTAVAISQANFAPNVDTVYLANGLNFPDALSAGALAAQLGAPVILTVPTSLPDAVRDELIRLSPERIVIVGGYPSVSADVEALVEALPFSPDVVRFAGANRFDTNQQLIRDAQTQLGGDPITVAYVSNGLNFPDALAAAPAAASKGGVVVLVNGSATSLDAATLDLLDDLGVEDIYITGDVSSVSAGIQSQLNSIYPGHVTRFAGVNRFDTASRIVAEAWPEGAGSAILSNGLNFPDALAAGALGDPLLTSTPTCIPDVVLAQLSNLQLSDVTLVGDSSSLSAAVKNFTRC
ncbi:cell wall-binding repeat-containing protein [Schumannella luteola]